MTIDHSAGGRPSATDQAGEEAAVSLSAKEVEEITVDEQGRLPPRPPLNPPRSGGTPPDMDGWQQSVELRLGQLHGDVRALLRYGVGAAVALAMLIGGLYLYVNDKFESAASRLSNVELAQQRASDKLDTVLERLPVKK